MMSRASIHLNHTRNEAARVCLRAAEVLQRGQMNQRGFNQDRIEEDAVHLARILTSQLDIGDTTEDSSRDSSSSHHSSDYCPDDTYTVPGTSQVVTLDTMKVIVRLRETGRSHDSIENVYRWYNRKMYKHFYECVQEGGSARARYIDVDQYTMQRVREAREQGRPVHDYLIRQWATQRANEINLEQFACSNQWLSGFKKRNKVRSKKITDRRSSARIRIQEAIDDSRDAFVRRYADISELFPHNLIFNIDQSGINYEPTPDRTLDLLAAAMYLSI